MTGYGDYSFDKGKDPLFGAMKDSYLGDIGKSKEKLTGSTAVTGGSTLPGYAGAAAGQSGNYYGTRLNDFVPEAEQNAYEKYLKDFGIKSDQLGVIAADKNFEFGKYLKQQELDMAAAQQQFANDLLLHQNFDTAAPAMPDMSTIGTGAKTAFAYDGQEEFKKLLDEVMNQEAFSYDMAADPVGQSLRKSYLREGRRAGEDALARASAGSMGVPSSYAIRVAADAENGYNEQLMGALPDLEGNEYARYLQDFSNKVGKLGALETDRESDYQRFLQEYQLEQQKKQQAFDNAMALYRTIGLTPEIAAALGVPYVAPSSGDDEDSGYGVRRKDEPAGSRTISEYGQVLGEVRSAKAAGNTNSQINQVIMSAQRDGKINEKQASALKKGYLKK